MPRLTPNREYCSIARGLELLGERWTLHIVRDLMTGPKRFGDLLELVVGVTPKWLTARLRALEAGGVVERVGYDYQLTPRGQTLRPMMEELSLWSSAHDTRPPRPEETVIPEHDMWALEVYLNHGTPSVKQPVTWLIELTDAGPHTLQFDGDRWAWQPTAATNADVVLTTTARAWSSLLAHAQMGQQTPGEGYELRGRARSVKQFRSLFAIA